MSATQTLKQHARFIISLVFGVLVGLFLYSFTSVDENTGFILGFDAAAILFLLLVWRMTASDLRMRASQEREGQAIIFSIVFLASAVSLLAIVRHIAAAKGLTDTQQLLHISLAITTIILSWLMIQTLFALQYAHLSMTAEHKKTKPPILFAEDMGQNLSDDMDNQDHTQQPTHPFSDFLYCALIIGTSAQTADIGFATTEARKLAGVHSVLSFMFNIAVLSLLVNVVSGYM